MLVFHGTGGDRALIDTICVEGLVPAKQAWAHDTTGIEEHVFVCTTPIGTRGGDPIQFAQRGAYGDRRAWLFVLDVPRALVRGAVPNGELEQYWFARTFAEVAFDRDRDRNARHTRALIERKRERRCATRELLEYVVLSTATDLLDGPPDGQTLVQFEHAYMRAQTAKQKQRVAVSFGLRISEDYATDSHSPWCRGCLGQLFQVAIGVIGEPDVQFARGSWQRLDLATFGTLVDALDRWLTAAGDPPLSTLAALQRSHPPPRSSVPRTLWPDFVTADLDARSKLPDTQLLLDHVPPEHIVGVIDLGDHDRLSGLVRPLAGEVLMDKLGFLARQLVDRRKKSSTPIVLD